MRPPSRVQGTSIGLRNEGPGRNTLALKQPVVAAHKALPSGAGLDRLSDPGQQRADKTLHWIGRISRHRGHPFGRVRLAPGAVAGRREPILARSDCPARLLPLACGSVGILDESQDDPYQLPSSALCFPTLQGPQCETRSRSRLPLGPDPYVLSSRAYLYVVLERFETSGVRRK